MTLNGAQIHKRGIVLTKSEDGKLNKVSVDLIGPCSVDVTLGEEFAQYKGNVLFTSQKNEAEYFSAKKICIVPRGYDFNVNGLTKAEKKEVDSCDRIIYGSVLGVTNEIIKVSSFHEAEYHGRSSIGRLHLISHATAGIIDPGFRGCVTLEISTLDKPVIIESGMRIGQIVARQLKKATNRLYKGKYQDAETVQASRIEQDFENPEKKCGIVVGDKVVMEINKVENPEEIPIAEAIGIVKEEVIVKNKEDVEVKGEVIEEEVEKPKGKGKPKGKQKKE